MNHSLSAIAGSTVLSPIWQAQIASICGAIFAVQIETKREQYIRHNGTPASLVSLKTLPNGFVTADIMRYVTATKALGFPHEIVVDLMTTEKQAAKKDLQKRIDRIDGSRNTWLRFRNLKRTRLLSSQTLRACSNRSEGTMKRSAISD
ncbi:MAG: hypothetical protein IPQ00_17455 [Chloracidobacterium sp.]|nr:hypothetical protein [Chloracidobacterium sp.]